MAIIDKNLVFLDQAVLTNTTSRAVPLTGLTLAGRMHPIPLRITITQGYEADKVQRLTLTMQQAAAANAPESGDGQWQDIAGATLEVTGDKLTEGARLPWRFLPEDVCDTWVRLKVTLTPKDGQKPTKGAIFAALLREEDFPYIPRLQVQ